MLGRAAWEGARGRVWKEGGGQMGQGQAGVGVGRGVEEAVTVAQ